SHSRLERAAKLAQRFHHLIAPSHHQAVEVFQICRGDLPFVFREEQKKQEQIHVHPGLVLKREASGGYLCARVETKGEPPKRRILAQLIGGPTHGTPSWPRHSRAFLAFFE